MSNSPISANSGKFLTIKNPYLLTYIRNGKNHPKNKPKKDENSFRLRSIQISNQRAPKIS
jgi:hypothetical protein